MGYIYILTSPSGKSYIGQTIRPIEKRLEEHETGKSKDCRAIYNAIQYHGWDNFEKDWYECPDKDLNFDEELLVREMGTLSPNGYNLVEGGGSNGKPSEESKQKMSEAHRGEKHNFFGKTHTEETKQKQSEAHRGEKHNFFGKTHTKETKQKQSEANVGDKNRLSKRVYQYDLDGNLICSFGSVEEAGRYLHKKSGSKICACARGVKGHKTAYGFKWSYTNVEKLDNM